MNTLPKYVATRRLRELEWNASPIGGDVPAAVAALKQPPGQDILIYGSGELVRELTRHHLIDQYRLMVHPIVVGSGKRLFDEQSRIALRLVDTRTTSTGVLLLSNQPADA